MKYRTDFVTNSSSTSFAAAAGSIILSLIAAFGGGSCGNNNNENSDTDVSMQKTIMPEGASKVVSGSKDSVYLYAQVVQQTLDGVAVLAEPTRAIDFEITAGDGWIEIGSQDSIGEWKYAEIIGVSPKDFDGQNPPDSVTIKAKSSAEKARCSTAFNLKYEAESALKVKPFKAELLSKTGDTIELKVNIINPGTEKWKLDIELDSFAQKLCTASLEDISDNCDSATLKIIEADTIVPSGSGVGYYDKGRITLKAVQGEKELTDYAEVTVWREGLFLKSDTLDIDRETGAVVVAAQREDDGSMKVSNFDLIYMKWNEDEKKLKSDTSVFATDDFDIDDPSGESEEVENMLAVFELKLEYSNKNRELGIPSAIFNAQMSSIVPGKSDDKFKVNVSASVDNGEDVFELEIPFIVKPDYLTAQTNALEKEYELCKKIINEFFKDEGKRTAKIQELDNIKHGLGAEDIKTFRKQVWDAAQDAAFKERDEFLAYAQKCNIAVGVFTVVDWVCDRIFSSIAGTVLGPLGAYTAKQIKKGITDLIIKLEEKKDSQGWYDFSVNYAWSLTLNLTSGGIDTVVKKNAELSVQWVVSFYLYKFSWHWYFDKNSNGERKGVFAAATSAGIDLTGVGVEKALKPFIEEAANRQGLGKDDRIDEFVRGTIQEVRLALIELADAAR